MRIAMMTDSYLPTRDGVVTSVCIMKESLEALGHEVFVIAPEPEPEFRQEGVRYFKAVRFRSYEGYYVPIFPSDKMDVMREIRPDVIHVHGVATMALRALICSHYLGIPTVMTFHTMVDDAARYYLPVKIPKDISDKLIWTYLRQVVGRMDVVVTPTACIGRELEEHGVKCRNLLSIPTGAKTDLFRPGIPCEDVIEKHSLRGKRVIAHVGRISYEKDIDMVVRAMPHIDAVLLIIGKGPARPDIEKLVREMRLEDKVVFAGFVADEDLPKYYNAADMVVSASRFETQGLTILEAMATGKPVACRNGRAFAEIVQDEVNGYLFDSDEDIVPAMEKCLRAPASVREASYRTAMENSRDKSARRYVEAYEMAVAAKGARGK